MEPTLKKGDHVSIDTTAKAIDRGGIYCFLVPNVARHAGDTRAYRIARVHALKDGYMIQPDNSKYPAEFVPAAEFGDLFVIGKVVMLQRDLWQ